MSNIKCYRSQPQTYTKTKAIKKTKSKTNVQYQMSQTPTAGDWVPGGGMSGGHLFQPGDNTFSSFCFLLFFVFFFFFFSFFKPGCNLFQIIPIFHCRCCCQLASWLFCCLCFFFIHFNILTLVVVVVGQVVVASTSKTFLKYFYH